MRYCARRDSSLVHRTLLLALSLVLSLGLAGCPELGEMGEMGEEGDEEYEEEEYEEDEEEGLLGGEEDD